MYKLDVYAYQLGVNSYFRNKTEKDNPYDKNKNPSKFYSWKDGLKSSKKKNKPA
jgi:hypothetical protein